MRIRIHSPGNDRRTLIIDLFHSYLVIMTEHFGKIEGGTESGRQNNLMNGYRPHQQNKTDLSFFLSLASGWINQAKHKIGKLIREKVVASRKFTPGTMQDSRPDVQGQKNYKINYRKCCGSGFDRIRTILSISNFRSDLIIYADSNRRKNYLFVYIFVKISV